MKQQLVAVVIGAMLGFLMPYGAKVWDKGYALARDDLGVEK